VIRITKTFYVDRDGNVLHDLPKDLCINGIPWRYLVIIPLCFGGLITITYLLALLVRVIL
jgi:hypothetical protein